MDIIISLIAGIVLGLVWGWSARERHAERQLDELLSHVSEHEQEELIQIVIEKDGAYLYAYGKSDKSYMAHGENRGQLEQNLQTRYPGKRFAASSENLKETGFE
jgi:hypothetical protein